MNGHIGLMPDWAYALGLIDALFNEVCRRRKQIDLNKNVLVNFECDFEKVYEHFCLLPIFFLFLIHDYNTEYKAGLVIRVICWA